MNRNKRIRVLYVEDDHDAFQMLKVMLDLSQIDVDSAGSVGEALIRADSERFDVYLLDTGLPDGSGIRLCSTFRTVYPKIPVLFYSGNTHPEAIKMGMSAGATAYITKPHSDKLASIIIHLVESQSTVISLPELAAAA